MPNNIGAFGENFPYTNQHDLNMDWIISLIRDFKETYPTVIEDINKKLNKPVINPDGSINMVLMSNGDGTTKWGNVADITEPEIYLAVSQWLAEHPEATTTVQDGSISYAKLTNYMKYMVERNQSGYISPVYIGDYLSDYNHIPSAVIRNGNDFITVDAPTREYATSQSSGTGIIETYNISSNSKTFTKNVLVGHGNSIAYDGTYFYIVPIWNYAEGAEIRNSDVYVYDGTFNLLLTLNAPRIGHAISYDPVSEHLYYLGDKYVYLIENNEFSLYSTITNYDSIEANIILDRVFNQDFAVYNNEFYLSSPEGTILHGKLTENECEVTDSFYVQHADSTNRYILGELEGFEFDEEGHLYAIMYTNLIANQLRDSFVVEIPVNKTPATSPVMNGFFNASDATLYLSSTTQAHFYLNTYEIRTLAQLLARININSTAVEIQSQEDVTDPYDIKIEHPISLILDGKYTCNRLTIQNPGFVIIARTSANRLTITRAETSLIRLERSATLSITGEYSLNVNAPNMTDNATNNFIDIEYVKPITIIKNKPAEINSKKLKIGSSILTQNGVYIGDVNLTYMPKIYNINHAMGTITNTSRLVRLYIHTEKPFSTTPTLSGTIAIRGTNGFVNSNSADSTIDLTGTEGYTITLAKDDDLNYRLEIEKTTAYTNVVNNTPCVVSGTITLTTE